MATPVEKITCRPVNSPQSLCIPGLPTAGMRGRRFGNFIAALFGRYGDAVCFKTINLYVCLIPNVHAVLLQLQPVLR